MLIVISGLVQDAEGNKGSAGAGKDTVANRLIDKHGFVKVGFADPMKRFVQELYQFSDDQVWGETKFRNEPDKRYIRHYINAAHMLNEDGLKEHPDGRVPQYLSPRYALQKLGTEWGRDCWEDTWSAYAYRIYQRLQTHEWYYDQKTGLRPCASLMSEGALMQPKTNVVISDLRFKNEFRFFKNKPDVKTIRVFRPTQKLFVKNDHQSENDLNDIPNEEFDYVIHGRDNDVPGLQLLADRMMDVFTGRLRPYDEEQADIPPFKRR